MIRFFTVLLLLCTANLPFPGCYGSTTQNGQVVTLSDIQEKIDGYQGQQGENFIKVLSWSYDNKLQENLREFILTLDPTIIAIQNMTGLEFLELKSSNSNLDLYAVAGIKAENDIKDDDILNPIFFKSSRLQPVRDAKFTGFNETESGQMAWAQFMLDSPPERRRRNLPDSNIEKLWGMLSSYNGTEKCNVEGSLIVVNGNMKNTSSLEKDTKEMLNSIYEKVMCRRGKKIFLVGNVGWTECYKEIFKFAKRRLRVNTFNINESRNINQIWSSTRDFRKVSQVSGNIRKYLDESLERAVSSCGTRFAAPSFSAYHEHKVEITDKK